MLKATTKRKARRRAYGLTASAALLIGSFQSMAAQEAQETVAPAAPPIISVPDAKAAAGVIPAVNPNFPKLIPTSAFASRNALHDTKLSPDGSKFAFRVNVDGRNQIAIYDANTLQPISALDVGSSGNMKWFRWAGNNRILFSKRSFAMLIFLFLPASRLMVHDLETQETSFVGLDNQGFEGDDVLHVDPEGEHVTLALSEGSFSSPSVFRFKLDGSGSATAEIIQKRQHGINEWWADNTGAVRLGMKRNGRKKVSFYYRSNDTQDLERVVKVRRDDDAFDNWDILSIRAGTDIGYALVKDDRGLNVLREFNYKTGLPGALIHADDRWSLEGAVIETDGVLQGATLTDDFPRTHWIDPEMANVQARLESSLGEGRVRILSRAGTDRMIIWHGGANDPGVLYVYSPAKNKLEVFGELRPDVDFKQLSGPVPVQYQARDGTMISAYLTLPKGRDPRGLPMIINPHGGPYGIRDTLVYRDDVQLLANRGYIVLQPNYRGSGGYGEAFEKLGDGQIGRKMQDDLDDAMDWAVAQGYADPARVCVVGGSYGGYAALWSVIRNPERYRCAASWAGVTDFDAQLKYDRDFFERRAGKRWRKRIEGEERDFDLDDVSPALQADRLTRPILLAHGRKDRVVPYKQFLAMRKAVKSAGITNDKYQELVIDGEGHSFTKQENEQKWYDSLIRFLADHNPSDVNVPALYPDEEVKKTPDDEAVAASTSDAEDKASKANDKAAAETAAEPAQAAEQVEAEIVPESPDETAIAPDSSAEEASKVDNPAPE